jgi:hypothetical protein
MPAVRYSQFTSNIVRCRELVGLGKAIYGITVGSVDATDMYRAALVQSVAALDSYVHDVVLDYGVDIIRGVRPPGSSRSRVGLHISAVYELTSAPNPTELELRARAAINDRLSLETFQKPDDIANAFAMVGVGMLWAGAFGAAAGTTKTALSLVVRRRNGIVHRCDVDTSGMGTLYPLSDVDALDAIATVESVVAALDSYV